MRPIALVLTAALLAYFSPWMASPDDGLIMWAWFNWLPTLAAQWTMTSSLAFALTVDVGVLTLQYLCLFSVIALLRPLVSIAADFISAPRHRRGLVR